MFVDGDGVRRVRARWSGRTAAAAAQKKRHRQRQPATLGHLKLLRNARQVPQPCRLTAARGPLTDNSEEPGKGYPKTVYSSAGPVIRTEDDAQPAPFAGQSAKWTVTLACITGLTVAYVGYFGLLIACDLLRVASLGFVPVFEAGAVTVGRVQPDSIGARAGLRTGDRLRRASGQILETPADWQRVRAYQNPAHPFDIEIERDGTLSSASLHLPSGLSEWRSGPGRPALLAFRLAQLITLGFAIVVAFRRDSQPSALLGAMLLASLATVSLALPVRLAAFWRVVPAVPAALLWIPFATSVAVGPLLFAFFAVFPRRLWSPTSLALAMTPAAFVVGRHVHAWHRIMR